MSEKRSTRQLTLVSVYIHAPNPKLQVLLLKRSKRKFSYWQPVTGIVEPSDRSISHAARREVKEETGLEASKLKLSRIYTFRFTKHGIRHSEHCFGLQVKKPFQPRLSVEHTQHRWVDSTTAISLVPWRENRKALDLLVGRLLARNRKITTKP